VLKAAAALGARLPCRDSPELLLRQGPDCFFSFLFKDLGVKKRDSIVVCNLLWRVLYLVTRKNTPHVAAGISLKTECKIICLNLKFEIAQDI
jgi:hypothetical protein